MVTSIRLRHGEGDDGDKGVDEEDGDEGDEVEDGDDLLSHCSRVGVRMLLKQ